MRELTFDWDARKDRENRKKHGVAFSEAESVFADDNARLLEDPDHSDSEDRFILLGLSSSLRTLIVCHCYRQGDTVIRIISARKATKKEREQYAEAI